MKWTALLLVLLSLGCGKTSYCSGTACACPAGATCAFDACDSTTSGCDYVCAAESTCTGLCGSGCRIACDGSLCTFTVGASSSISCGAGTCRIACTGACTATGVGKVEVTCRGGTKTDAGCQ